MIAVSKAEGIEGWDPDFVAVLLHPYIGSHFATDFFVHRAGILLFGKLVRHGTTENQLSRPAAGGHHDDNADVESALNPRVDW